MLKIHRKSIGLGVGSNAGAKVRALAAFHRKVIRAVVKRLGATARASPKGLDVSTQFIARAPRCVSVSSWRPSPCWARTPPADPSGTSRMTSCPRPSSDSPAIWRGARAPDSPQLSCRMSGRHASEVVLVPCLVTDLSQSKLCPAVCPADAARGDRRLRQATSGHLKRTGRKCLAPPRPEKDAYLRSRLTDFAYVG